MQIVYNKNSLYLCGGSVNDTSIYKLDLAGNTWEVLKVTGTPSPARQVFPMYSWEEYLYVFPGYTYDSSDYSMGCYRFQVLTYTWTDVDCDIDRVIWAYVGADQYLALFGGANSKGSSNELTYGLLGDPISTIAVTANFTYPSPRFKHSMQHSRTDLWLFGGYSDGVL